MCIVSVLLMHKQQMSSQLLGIRSTFCSCSIENVINVARFVEHLIYLERGIGETGPDRTDTEGGRERYIFLAATKQLYEWYFLSVCPSVRLSVRLSVCPSVTPFWLCSHHRIIMKFSGVITLDQGKVHAKGQGQRSKVKVTEVTTQIFVSGL